MYAASWVQSANSSRSIVWLLVKSSSDINDHILSPILRKMRQLDGILPLFYTLHITDVRPLKMTPSDQYTLNTMSVLLWLAECACIVERTSNVAYSSIVLDLLGDLVLLMAVWYAQCLLLLCKLSPPTAWSSIYDFRTSDHPSSEDGRISSHTKCSTISLDDRARSFKILVNNYWWELSARFMHNNISVQNTRAIWGCFC